MKDLLREKRGVAKHFSAVFSAMCDIAGVRVNDIHGFAKGHGYMPGKSRQRRGKLNVIGIFDLFCDDPYAYVIYSVN